MSNSISRRKMLGLTAGAAAGTWVFALNGRGEVVRAASDGAPFTPTVFTPDQLQAVAKLCETIIPRSNTPGAIDARVHEYIDVRLSGRYEDERRRFLSGLNWLEGYSAAKFGESITALNEPDRVALLESISDEHDALPDELHPGQAYFRLLKEWTIHGYFTSREGRVETLGLPEFQGMQQWVGCTHTEH